MALKTTQIKKILKDPGKAAETVNLIYLTEEELTINRHRHGKGFFLHG